MPAHNERFGATAAERADLKGSAGMPPLRQAAIPLAAMQDDSVVVRMPYREWSTIRQCSGKVTEPKMPAAISLAVSVESVVEKVVRIEKYSTDRNGKHEK